MLILFNLYLYLLNNFVTLLRKLRKYGYQNILIQFRNFQQNIFLQSKIDEIKNRKFNT